MIAAENAYIPARMDCMDDEAKHQQANLLPLDFHNAAKSRDAIISRWRSLFEQK